MDVYDSVVGLGSFEERTAIDSLFRLSPINREPDATVEVLTAPLPLFKTPRFSGTKACDVGVSLETLAGLSDPELWRRHMVATELCRAGYREGVAAGHASLLDLKAALATRLLRKCSLCAMRCGVDRTQGQYGECGLGTEFFLGRQTLHMTEEAPINPSLLLSLAGCGLRCKYCQQWPLQDARKVVRKPLSEDIWAECARTGARSLSFTGGNPDESLPAVLGFLNSAPDTWRLPIVWNTHAYVLSRTLCLLEGIVDCYVPDFKYGNPECGMALSLVPDYPAVAKEAIGTMLRQNVPVIVRILVLPGHSECCHKPALRELAAMRQDNLMVSIRGKYRPEWCIGPGDGALTHLPDSEEVRGLCALGKQLNLNVID